jgi:hypothetical protein
MNFLDVLHYYSRKIVLPSDKIKKLCKTELDGNVK